MLVLTRKVNERIRVGDDVVITVVRLGPGSVRLGIDAPGHLTIVREELTHGESSAALAGVDIEVEP
jgi:carbon storage regulator